MKFKKLLFLLSSDQLQAGASQFEHSAARLKRKMWWQNCKVCHTWIYCIVTCVLTSLCVALFSSISHPAHISGALLGWKLIPIPGHAFVLMLRLPPPPPPPPPGIKHTVLICDYYCNSLHSIMQPLVEALY